MHGIQAARYWETGDDDHRENRNKDDREAVDLKVENPLFGVRDEHDCEALFARPDDAAEESAYCLEPGLEPA